MKEHNSVYLAWQSSDTRIWHVVGLLKEHDAGYSFNYTKGALASDKFIAFNGMEDMNKTYISEDLFPLFKNRILSSKRPEYPSFLKWIGLDSEDASALNVLGRSGGLRSTDKLQMFKRFEIDDNGKFEQIFFVHGLSHLQESASQRISELKPGDTLKLCLDVQNDYDRHAVFLRADSPAEIIGFCPRYITRDITKLIVDYKSDITITVESLCDEAPANYRLMCKLNGSISTNKAPEFMNQEEFQTILSS
ncbi:HIRAN domain-containing protein [Candidatus Sororendozoicomonas aggregata]|uniref:HIRAN domain-containing protein n=1 Tax=Candidatus Sororendozoicomonas aggregata TaxID=3073239 RepID=UPI002ED20F8C